jgi:CubicO group peptidase (beta-lactamase class C family)
MTLSPDAIATVDRIADRFLVGRHVPGVAYGVVVDGQLVHHRGLGTLRVGEDAVPAADSVFRIASMTKSFTAATVLALRDEGALALDDPVARYVPELAMLRGPTADAPAITIRQLLSMMSGLATDDPWGDRQQGLDLGAFSRLLSGPLTFAWTPGTRFEYSNLGYGILGRVITNVAGAEYSDVVAARMIRPLGLVDTTYLLADVDPERLARGYVWRDDAYLEEPIDGYGALASMGGIFTSVRDLARWIGFFTEAYPARDDPEPTPILARASRREMQRTQATIGPTVGSRGLEGEPVVQGPGYGFGLFIEENLRFGRIVGHSGGYPGYGSNMRWHPASGLGVIVLTNHRYGPSVLLSRELHEALLAAGVVTARRIQPTPDLRAARAAVAGLLTTWDDAVAERWFAMNVELDEPLARRRSELERIRSVHGPLSPDPDLPERADTPVQATWWLRGELGGRVRVDLLLSPESPPRIQTFGLTSVPEPGTELAAAGAAIAAAIDAPDPDVPDGLDLASEVDRASLYRALRSAAARFSPIRLGPAVAGDGATNATWRLWSERGELALEVRRDPASGRITTVNLGLAPPIPPPDPD